MNDERACEGGYTMSIPRGDGGFERCVSCGKEIRWDLADHPFIGFAATCREIARKGPSSPSQPSPTAETWQPIETAPKDGTWIIGLCSDDDVRLVSWGRSRNCGLQWCSRYSWFTLKGWIPAPSPASETPSKP